MEFSIWIPGALAFRLCGTHIDRILRQAEILSKGIALENCPGFQAQVDGLRLKCCIRGENPKSESTGRNPLFLFKVSPSR
jgi:hypothetical protein